MKKLLFLLLLAMNCHAETIATSENENGGLIVLTNEKCVSNKSGLLVYSTSPKNPTITGCWKGDENFIHILWSDGTLRSYEFGLWTMKKKKETM